MHILFLNSMRVSQIYQTSKFWDAIPTSDFTPFCKPPGWLWIQIGKSLKQTFSRCVLAPWKALRAPPALIIIAEPPPLYLWPRLHFSPQQQGPSPAPCSLTMGPTELALTHGWHPCPTQPRAVPNPRIVHSAWSWGCPPPTLLPFSGKAPGWWLCFAYPREAPTDPSHRSALMLPSSEKHAVHIKAVCLLIRGTNYIFPCMCLDKEISAHLTFIRDRLK